LRRKFLSAFSDYFKRIKRVFRGRRKSKMRFEGEWENKVIVP